MAALVRRCVRFARRLPHRGSSLCALSVVALSLELAGCARPAPTPDLYATLQDPGLAARVAAEQDANLLADLPKISTHEHFSAAAGVAAYRRVASQLGIHKVVLLPTGGAPDDHGYREKMARLLELAKQQPDFIVPFASLHPDDPDAPQVLADAVAKGARGLKLMSGHPDYYTSPLDSPAMLRVFAKVRELHIPVLIHVSPMRLPQQMAEFEHLLASFPEVTVVAAHYARTTPTFAETARLLDRYPNLYMDLSMGRGLPRYQGEIPRNLAGYREFILKYQDRLLWGTDMILGEHESEPALRARITTDFLLLGTRLYVDPAAAAPTHVEVGLDLPRDVLAKIFERNPGTILGIR